MELFILLFYALIILLNFFAQFSKRFQEDPMYDLIFVVFVFRLFAPNPITADTKIFYRDLLKNGQQTSLSEYKYFNKPHFKNTLWKFSNCKHLIIYRYIRAIRKQYQAKKDEIEIFNSMAFKKLENDIRRIGYSELILKRQIAIYSIDKTNPENEPDLILIYHINYSNA